MMQESVLGGGEHANGIHSDMLVEAFVLCGDEGLEEGRINFLVLHGCTVLVEVFAYQLALGIV